MLLTSNQITRFQEIYQKRFGKKISREEALEKGIKLVRLMQIVYRPITKEEYKKLQARRKQTGDL